MTMLSHNRQQQLHCPLHGLWLHPLSACVASDLRYHGYPVTVTLVSYESAPTLRIQLQQTGVRATSLACLLGLGLGLGSLLLYRLCRRLFGAAPCTTAPPVEKSPVGDAAQSATTTTATITTSGCRHGTHVPSLHHHATRERSASHASTSTCSSSCYDQPSPDGLSDSGVSTMGNYQSDTSAVVSPDSTVPSVLYNATGSVRFRGFRKDVNHRVLEEERNPLMSGSGSSNCNHSDDDSDDDDGISDDDDDETAGLLSGHRRKSKRSPASIRQQLTIDIPLDESSLIRYQRGLGTPGSEIDGHGSDTGQGCGLQREVSFDGQSIGGMSLMPNFSPTSLHEKNLRLVDDDDEAPESPKCEEGVGSCNNTDNGVVGKPQLSVDLSVDLESESSIPRGSATELTTCTLHPLQQSGDSLGSTNESDSSKMGGEGTQSEYLSSEPRSRSLSPEVMTILSKYRNSFDSSGSASPECVKRGTSRRNGNSGNKRTVKLSTSEPNKGDIDEWLDQRRRPCLKHSSSSISSTTSSVDLSSRDLTLRARSLDFSDNPSGMATPDSDLFMPGDVGLKTAASMEQIQKELVNLEQEIADMSSKFLVLSSRDNLHTVDPVSDAPCGGAVGGDGALANVLRVLVRHRSRDEAGMTRSLSACDEQGEAEALAEMTEESKSVVDDLSESRMWRYSYHHQGQYVWDYQSDFAATGKTPPSQHRGFVDHWGTLSECGESPQHTSRSHSHSRSHSGAQSPSFDHVLSHLRQSHHSSMDSDIPQTSSLADIYIDDGLSDLSGLVTGDAKLQVDGLLQAATTATNSDVTSLDSADSVTSVASSCDTNSAHQAAPPVDSEYTRLGPPEAEADTNDTHANADSGPGAGLFIDCEYSTASQTQESGFLCGGEEADGNRRFNMQQKSDGMVSVGPRVDLLTYAKQEWRGDTAKARTILKGYEEISTLDGPCELRRVRGDNYCALRAVLFQSLRTGAPLLQHLGTKSAILQKLSIFTGAEYSYLQEDWTFAGRLHQQPGSIVDTAEMCITELFDKIEDISSRTSSEEREQLTELLLNQSGHHGVTSSNHDVTANANDVTGDVVLMEGVKLVMLLAVQELLGSRNAGRMVPTFAELLFARDTSDTLRGFVRNHLNTVGASGGLEQIEMFLLGYALGVHIRVYRPAYHGQLDFCTSYADDGSASAIHTVTLIAEDDRHYNVLL